MEAYVTPAEHALLKRASKPQSAQSVFDAADIHACQPWEWYSISDNFV